MVIVQRAGVGTAFNGQIMDENVNVICCHAGLDILARQTQNVGGHVAGVTHLFNNLRTLDLGFIPPWDFTRGCVRRLAAMVRHSAHWRDNTGCDATLKTLVATLIFAARSAPTLVVGLRKNRWCFHSARGASHKIYSTSQALNRPFESGSDDLFIVSSPWFRFLGTHQHVHAEWGKRVFR
ncbi:unannotated protein [freshwater metagenome]|uniref:Unannotated protein n=1 Tax=freshwater metagenome TaxID=449393 RepID=A0A6J7VWA6_9ZZZZ